jgi:rRNA maturation endonuclease Nob1
LMASAQKTCKSCGKPVNTTIPLDFCTSCGADL